MADEQGTSEYVQVAVDGAVATITLNEPRRLNPVTGARIAELNQAVGELSRRDDVAVVVITGAGRGFCSGADLDELGMESALGPGSGSIVGPAGRWTLAALPQPVIAMVNGAAIGYGCELALQADIRIAGASAVFALPFAQLGGASDTGAGSWVLPRLVGLDHAAEMLYTGRKIDAAEAAARGLVTRVVPDDDLRGAVNQLVSEMVSGSHWSLRALKHLLWAGLEQRPAEHLLLQHHYQQNRDSSVDLDSFAARFRR